MREDKDGKIYVGDFRGKPIWAEPDVKEVLDWYAAELERKDENFKRFADLVTPK